MKKEYDFSKMKSVKNPYAKYLKKLAKETGITYQNLINLYLADCAESHKKLKLVWKNK
ncbi:MAG TPA: antitoxin [Spirochaetota bacterium]|nr:antitoxin [Spirochaetota bacterium]